MQKISLTAPLLLVLAATPAYAADCQVRGEDHDDADVVRARAACETARRRFRELLGDPVPAVRVILWDRPGYRIGTADGRAFVFWPADTAARPPTDDESAADRHQDRRWGEVLPHEIAHALLAARFFSDHEPTHPGYGTPFPDWLDEAVAIWAEPVSTRQRRLARARSLPAELLDLRTILGAPHPATGNAAALAVRDGAPVPRDELLLAFYPQSIAVLSFIYDAGGRRAVSELARRLLAGDGELKSLASLPGLPVDAEGVIDAWAEWLGDVPSDTADH